MVNKCAGWPHGGTEHHDCQFGDEAPDYEFGGNNYCHFHLPMGGRGEGGKADWGDDQKAAISNVIVECIMAKQTKKPSDEFQRLDFGGVVIPGRLDLSEKEIEDDKFGGTQFYGEVSFQRALFQRNASFDEAQFHAKVSFEEAQFPENAWFRKVQFHENVSFGKARFHGSTWFNGARFHGTALFEAARFHTNASFHQARFHGNTWFDRARFGGVALFNEAVFLRAAWFDSAVFHRIVSFRLAQFRGVASFTGSTDTTQTKARQFYQVLFERVTFGSTANFSNREFRDHTDFRRAVFEIAPNFHGSTLHQDTAFGDIECFRDVASDRAADAYRTLRLAMEEHRARLQEGMFFALEQKARRRNLSMFNPASWLSLGYELGSDYGLSVGRPLLWITGGIIVSTFLLYTVGFYGVGSHAPAAASPDLAVKASDALLFSVRQTFRPFEALFAHELELLKFKFNPGGTEWLRVWGLVLSLFEALAVLLLILAVRWRYRR